MSFAGRELISQIGSDCRLLWWRGVSWEMLAVDGWRHSILSADVVVEWRRVGSSCSYSSRRAVAVGYVGAGSRGRVPAHGFVLRFGVRRTSTHSLSLRTLGAHAHCTRVLHTPSHHQLRTFSSVPDGGWELFASGWTAGRAGMGFSFFIDAVVNVPCAVAHRADAIVLGCG